MLCGHTHAVLRWCTPQARPRALTCVIRSKNDGKVYVDYVVYISIFLGITPINSSQDVLEYSSRDFLLCSVSPEDMSTTNLQRWYCPQQQCPPYIEAWAIALPPSGDHRHPNLSIFLSHVLRDHGPYIQYFVDMYVRRQRCRNGLTVDPPRTFSFLAPD